MLLVAQLSVPLVVLAELLDGYTLMLVLRLATAADAVGRSI